MIKHTRDGAASLARTVILGGSGFVGRAASAWLQEQGAEVAALSSADLDLKGDNAAGALADLLKPTDTLVVISAVAPVKDVFMLEENIQMGRAVCEALSNQPVDHLLYVSSDAVYSDSDKPMDEGFCAEPGSLHGVMHLARELMFQDAAGDAAYGILRPTLVYGPDDPHNGYGPNMYRRRLAAGENIFLFGKGEERRDHVFVRDVGELLGRMVVNRSVGKLNAVTGRVVSFHDIADLVMAEFPSPPDIDYRRRSGPMPHNGYRAFDASAVSAAFPDFSFTSIEDGIALCHAEDPAVNS